MKTFIVYAHAEPRSFNGALFQTAQETLRDAGHTVVTSDLYTMKFDPVSDRRNFTTVKNPDFFKLKGLGGKASFFCTVSGIIRS